ncbi:hypothetical protein [Nocardioides daeguensis]|uniref:Uncharacterized protein n=1 Tax=Nocardioides daeguensis TaxID=908359 RepID=A0ABP6WH44_9ACTN|nr:hypothetical protein [Nocardioides daeguensis]MBV6729110.1 hypothetical protein [Nocardioides daeguensis]MCR1774886.1 hypothetical protein [Nocardioides daeguensis]
MRTTKSTSIRKQLLGLTTAALAVGTLGLAGSPAQAVGGIDGGNISSSGDVPNSVDVAAFGSGDAVAAWAREVPGGTKVYAAIATDGVWAAPKAVTAAAVTDAHDVQVAANDQGDAVVVWTQTILGEERVRGSRHLANDSWDGSAPLSGDTDSIESTDVAMDGAGRVYVASGVVIGPVHAAHVTTWTPGQTPQHDQVDGLGVNPSIAVSPSGNAVVAYRGFHDGDYVASVSRRTPTTGWTAPDSTTWPGDVVSDVQVDVADDGAGTILFGGKENGKIRAVTAGVTPAGEVTGLDIVSPDGVDTAERALHVSPNGRAVATWSTYLNDDYAVGFASRQPGSDWGTASVIESNTVTFTPTAPLVSDRGAQVVVHNDADQLTLRHHTNPVLPWGQYDAGPANGAFAADMDRDGNVVAVGVVENGFNSYVQADFLDIAGPTAKITAPGTAVAAPSFDVAWNLTDTLSGVKSTDVMVRTAAWNGGFGPQQVIADNVTNTSAQPFAGTFGSTHCFQAQGTDKANNLGFRSEERCTTVPLDDTALSGKKWKRTTKAGAFNNTVTTTTKKGRKLTLTGVQARHLDLLLTKAKKGGKVKVYWNGTLVKKISLKGKAGQVTVPVLDLGTVQAGTLKVKVVSKTGRKVTVDGLVAAK